MTVMRNGNGTDALVSRRNLTDLAVQTGSGNIGVTGILDKKPEAAPVLGPDRRLDVTVQRAGKGLAVFPVCVRDVEMADVIGLAFPLVSGKGDVFAVRAGGDRMLMPGRRTKTARLAAIDREGINTALVQNRPAFLGLHCGRQNRSGVARPLDFRLGQI